VKLTAQAGHRTSTLMALPGPGCSETPAKATEVGLPGDGDLQEHVDLRTEIRVRGDPY
jgi:hypothetical protein